MKKNLSQPIRIGFWHKEEIMRFIKENGLNILKADENKLLKVIGDDYKPQIKDEEGNIIEEEYIPYTTDTVYLGKSIDTIEKAKNIYEEIEKKN